ncbi:MAG: hypothetical protein WC046_02935 [Candidatus Bathyarchaeia archaeon]
MPSYCRGRRGFGRDYYLCPPISPRVNTPIPQSHQPEQEVVTLEQYKKTLTVEKRY